MKDILTLAAQARDQLQLTQLDEGRALVTKISALIETTKKAVARRLEEAKKDVESLTGVIHKLNMISTTEWTELRLLGKKAGEAVAKGTQDYAKLVGDFRDAINLARTRTDQETLLARFKDKSNKPGSPELIAAYKACVTENIKEVVEMGFRDKLKLRLVEDKKDGDFKIDVKGGDDHAFDRHTREGIWGARKVLTAHPSQVAIFDSADALTKALKEAPTKRSAWKEQGGGRVDADVGPVHYQGVSLGGTVALFSVYPTDRNYNKKAVEGLLERMIEAGGSFSEFCDELEKCR